MRLSPGSGFLSIIDMSMVVTKGDVKLHSTLLCLYHAASPMAEWSEA